MKSKWIVLLLILSTLLTSCDRTPDVPNETSAASEKTEGITLPTVAYELKYASNGDGTCYVSEIVYNEGYVGEIHLEIPAVSPSGERVLYVLSEEQCSLVPSIILKEDFDAHLLLPLKKKVESGELENFYFQKLQAYFKLHDPSTASTSEKLEKMIQEMPLCEFAPVYTLAPDLSRSEMHWLFDLLTANTDYTYEKKWQDDQRLIAAAKQYLSEDYADRYGLFKNHTEQVTSLTVAEGVLGIENSFENYTSLKSINLPDSLLYIGSHAFYNTAYEREAFNQKNREKLLYIGTHLVCATDVMISGELIIREGTISIASGIFIGFQEITSVTLPASLKGISSHAFWECTNLSRVNYQGTAEDWVVFCNPPELRYIENGTTKELWINREHANPLYYAGHLFINDVEVTEITIPEQVTRIRVAAFRNWDGLKTVIIPTHVTRVDAPAFYEIDALKVYVEAKERPSSWAKNWAGDNCEVIWNYNPKA